MRHLGALNFLYNHRNLRLFDAQRFNISHQRSGLFVCVARGWRTYLCGTGACVWYARVFTGTCIAVARVCVQGMTRVHVNMKCREKNGKSHVYFPFFHGMLLICIRFVTNVFVYKLYITVCVCIDSSSAP